MSCKIKKKKIYDLSNMAKTNNTQEIIREKKNFSHHWLSSEEIEKNCLD